MSTQSSRVRCFRAFSQFTGLPGFRQGLPVVQTMEGMSTSRFARIAPMAPAIWDDGKGREANMRKLLTFAGLVLLGSAIGCYHTDSHCNSCGGSGCGNSGCGTGSGHSGCGNHGPCGVGVCDCDITPLGPYTYPRAAAPQAAPPLAPPVDGPHAMQKVSAETSAPAVDTTMPKTDSATPKANAETPDK